MNTLLNIIWLLLAGLWLAISYAIVGVVCLIFIVTIPLGIAAFRIANYSLWPFGRVLVRDPQAGCMSMIGNAVWILIAGVWLAIAHILTGLVLCITVVGIPLAVANFKLVPVALLPLGARIITADSHYRQSAFAMYAPRR